MKRILLLVALFAFAAGPVLGDTNNKSGIPVPNNPGVMMPPSTLRSDFEYSTCGSMDCVATTGGSHDGWGEWFIVTIQNTTGHDLWLKEFGFPCCGPPTGACGWIVWTNVGGNYPPNTGDGCTADIMGQFTPVDPSPDTFPPTTYTYIDVASANICIPSGNWWAFGYDVTGNGGQVSYNGVDTYAWYSGVWDPDPNYGRTAILQIKADYDCGPVPVLESSWGRIKALYQ